MSFFGNGRDLQNPENKGEEALLQSRGPIWEGCCKQKVLEDGSPSRSGSSLARLLLGWRKPSLLLDRAGFFRPGLQRVARSGRPNLSWPDSIRKERVHHSLHIAMHSEPGLVFSGTVSPESRSVRAQPRTAYAPQKHTRSRALPAPSPRNPQPRSPPGASALHRAC